MSVSLDCDFPLLSFLRQAVVHCDRSKAPVFLRFLNMMINDATVQLDEGLEVGVALGGASLSLLLLLCVISLSPLLVESDDY